MFSFTKPSTSATSTDSYGTINMISFLCSIWSRLAYMNDHQYLGHYPLIFGPIIPDELMKMMNQHIVKNGIQQILDDTTMFNIKNNTDMKFGLKPFTNLKSGGYSLQFLPWAQKVNQANGEERLSDTNTNCDVEVPNTPSNPNIVFVSIATSNYGEVYVTGDKRMPNLVVITFRGTYSAKSAGAYTKPSSLTPIGSSSIEDMNGLLHEKTHEEFIFGIYKILMEISHVLMDTISYVAKQINPTGAPGSTQLLTTGHSLGGALCTIFAYLYVAHIEVSNYPQLNQNIACVSLGSPRVFGKELADIFCCLTSGLKSSYCNPEDSLFVGKGKITYLRVTSFNDPVPALPSSKVSNFVHPCSSTETTAERKKTNADCLVQIKNSKSTRCISSGRLAMTYDYNLPLECLDTKTTRKFNSPILINVMGYHTQYLGISYIGGISISESVGYEIARVKTTTDKYKSGDTVCRLILYPCIDGNTSSASVAFYDLVPQRSHGVGENDAQLEIAESKETGISLNGNSVPAQAPNAPQTASNSQTLNVLKNLAGFKKEEIRVFTEYGKLFIEGQKEDKESDSNYIHRGVAQRSFQRAWTIADDTEVKEVAFEDGLLRVELRKIVPDHHARKDYL